MRILSAEKIAKIPNEPFLGVEHICNLFNSFDEYAGNNPEDIDGSHFLEYWMLLKVFCAKHGLKFEQLDQRPPENPYNEVRRVFSEVQGSVQAKITEIRLEEAEAFFSAQLGVGTTYELSDADVEEINRKLGELRQLIVASEDLEEGHRTRILKRIEALQGEIHKRQSNFDKAIGTMAEVLTAVKKVGDAAAPWARIARDICAILFMAQGRSIGLPSSADTNLLK